MFKKIDKYFKSYLISNFFDDSMTEHIGPDRQEDAWLNTTCQNGQGAGKILKYLNLN